MMKIKYILYVVCFLSITGWGPLSTILGGNPQPFGTSDWMSREMQLISSRAANLNPHVLKLALVAYVKARKHGLDSKDLITVIDYTKPSDEKRLWVINVKRASVLYNTWVSHGRNSGRNYTTSFSNRPGSLQSSYGVFLTTAEPYIGANGYSLRLVGLEPGINDNAYRRALVIHGAWYADPGIAKRYGQLGRSWGCPAISERIAKPLIDTIKEKTLVFAYTNNQRWIRNSPYLRG